MLGLACDGGNSSRLSAAQLQGVSNAGNEDEIDASFERLVHDGAKAVLVASDAFFFFPNVNSSWF
jgi:uncharacterized glyoxalase superfamily protein PhnB